MAKSVWPKIKKRVYPSGEVAYGVDTRSFNGERKFFAAKLEAETFAELKRTERKNSGTNAGAISDKLRIEAMECDAKLKPLAVSLTVAVEYFIKHARPAGGKKTVNSVKDEFLTAKTDANRREEYLRVQRHILEKFCETFGSTILNEVHAEEIGIWLKSHEWSLRTRRNYHNDLSNFFGFAVRKNYCVENPLARLEKPTVDESLAPEIFSPSEAALLLNAADQLDGRMVPFIAIGLFAGLRTAELLKLDWRNVDFAAGIIEVTSNVSKTRDHRYVGLSENLVAWLTPYKHEKGPVKPAAWRWHRDNARKASGLKKWPDNGMRHSFGSYHFAHHNNASLTAAELGHRGETRTLFSHYRRLVKPAEAARYWNIMPSGEGEKKVVASATS